MIVGNGKFRYKVAEGWGQLPAGWNFLDVCGIAVDSQDRVYVLNRSEHPAVVFDRDGRFLASWGEGVFSDPHGITIGPDDSVYCVDRGDHTVKKFTTEGKLLSVLGSKDQPSDTGCSGDFRTVKRGGPPFNGPTRLVLSPSGEMYVTDGYWNARVHKYAPDGRLLFSWGEPGTGPGQFNLPHDICTDQRGRVYVADRENSRIQVFTSNGEFISQWTGLNRPCGLCVDSEQNLYVAEVGYVAGMFPGMTAPDIESPVARVSILTLDGTLQVRWGGEDSCAPGSFFAPHTVCVDSHGDLYVGEVVYAGGGREGLVPSDCHTIQKFVRIA